MKKSENKIDCFSESKKQVDLFLNKNRLPHAILVEGTDEDLKSELISYIANAIVCEGSLKPCGECSHCRKAQANIHPDIEFIQPSGVLKSFSVDAVRKIRENANILPNEAQRKVYILNGVDQMSVGAQNSLLKILEDPPKSVSFVLGVKSEYSLLPTIRSRMITFKLDPKFYDSDTELIELVDDLSRSMLSTKEFDIVKVTAPLAKDKQLLKKVFDQLIVNLKNAYMSILSENIESNFSKRLTIEQIFEIIDQLNEGIRLIERNVNVNLIITVTFFKIRKIIFYKRS